MAQNRRKYRDNTEEFMQCMGLFGGVIKQAFDDVRKLKENEKAVKYADMDKEIKYQDKKHAKYELLKSKEACRFFETRRLERFITSHTLPLEATYLRRKYKELRKEMG